MEAKRVIWKSLNSLARILQMLVERLREFVESRAVASGAEEEIRCLCRNRDGPQRSQAGVGDGRRRQAFIFIRVIDRIDLQIQQAEWIGPPGSLQNVIANGILNGRVRVQFHPDLETIQINGCDRR